MTWTPSSRARLVALLLAPTLSLACAKNNGKDSAAPDEIELPPENKVADASKGKSGKDADPDDKVTAAKVEPKTADKPEVVVPQDRDPNQEKAKMKRSREKSAKAKQLLRGGQTDQAIGEARNALKDHEQNVEAMLVIAEAFYKQGKHELVQSVSGSILKVDAKVLTPEEKSQAYNLMGFAYLQAGKRLDAFTAFKNAAETDANNASAWNNLGVQYMWRGDSKTAESCFEYAVSLDGKFAEAQLNWGASLRANGKLVEAERAFQDAAKLRPNWADVHFNLGVLYLDAEQLPNLDETAKLEAAIDEFEKYKNLVGSTPSPGKTKGKKQRGSSDAMGNELVSVAQADLYIKAANKGIESEARRIEREQKRKDRDAEQAAAEPEDAAGEDAAADSGEPAPAPSESPKQPQQPGAQQPGAQQPGPQQPGAQQPGAQQPGAQQPGAQQPGGGAQQPGAQQPPQQAPPAQQPPEQPSPQPQPPPSDKPAAPTPSEKPQAPAQPQKPQAQKPKPQKPGG